MFDSVQNWLVTPLSGATMHVIADTVAWHARLMVVAWGILIPLGVFLARFYKVWPGQKWPDVLDDKRWWHGHRLIQSVGMLSMLGGLVMIWKIPRSDSTAAVVHTFLGWFICATGALQIMSGVFRGSKGGPTEATVRGDHYDMSAWRRGFERLHKGLGWLALLLAVPTVGFGLVIADAPRWMACLLGGWWIALGIWFVRLQSNGRCIDTYQAIWGVSDSHPGNRVAPIGWGIKRYKQISSRERVDVANKN